MLFLIRHAQSANNAKPEHQRVPDPPITDVGDQQAQHLADWIGRLELTRLITSPFLRTLQTARRIHEATGLAPEVRAEWHEHGGCYSGHLHGQLKGEPGMSRDEIERDFPGYQVHESIDERGWWRGREWETVDEARQRAEAVAAQTLAEFCETKERIAFVTHADFKRFFVEAFHASWVEVPLNTSVTTIEPTADGLRLVEFNQVDHLPDQLQTW